MSMVLVCDGCHQPIEGTPEARGHVLVRHYCALCLPIVDEYLDKMDALQEKLGAQWAGNVLLFREDAAKAKPGMILPDTEDESA